MPSQQWNASDLLKQYGLILARKVGLIAVGWLVIFFISQPMRKVPEDGGVNILTLFGLLVGGFAGLVAGWYIATDAVEDSSLHGITLWFILVVSAVIPMLVIEGIMHAITKWPMNFGGFMVLASAILMTLATAVWHASSQE